MTSLAAASQGCSVYSFEPDKKAFPWLKKNSEVNSKFRIFPQNIALGAENTEIDFFSNPDSASASHISNAHTLDEHGNSRVKMTTLDDFVSTHNLCRVDLIKIDVEGFEKDVLEGASKTLKQFRPSVFLEINSFCLIGFRNITPRDMLSNVRSMFPVLYEYRENKLNKISTNGEELRFIHDNLVHHAVSDLYCCFEET